MTFEEFQKLGREDRLRVQLDDLALVGATQSGVLESAEISANSEFFGKNINRILTAARKVSQETQISEPTVLKVIKSYERTASRKAG